jgi:hypothetical protein
MQLTILAEEAANPEPKTKAPDAKGEGSTIAEMELAQLYQGFIDQARKVGASKKSLNTLIVEWHRYTQQYPIPHIPAKVCLEVFNHTVAEELAKDKKDSVAKEAGRLAYCAMLPALVDRESIRDFIACVVQGMALEIFPGAVGTRLLYGAQVAQAALPAVRKWRKATPKPAEKCTQTAPKQPSNPTPTPAAATA